MLQKSRRESGNLVANHFKLALRRAGEAKMKRTEYWKNHVESRILKIDFQTTASRFDPVDSDTRFTCVCSCAKSFVDNRPRHRSARCQRSRRRSATAIAFRCPVVRSD